MMRPEPDESEPAKDKDKEKDLRQDSKILTDPQPRTM
jgi:hypothetical protein